MIYLGLRGWGFKGLKGLGAKGLRGFSGLSMHRNSSKKSRSWQFEVLFIQKP